jgi:hypothetical protein
MISKQSCWVVTRIQGDYYDCSTTVERVFLERSQAEAFVSAKNQAIEKARGLTEAYTVLFDHWEKSHPRPVLSEPPYGKELDASFLAKDDEYARAFDAEHARLESLLGREAAFLALGCSYPEESLRYSITKVSFIAGTEE